MVADDITKRLKLFRKFRRLTKKQIKDPKLKRNRDYFLESFGYWDGAIKELTLIRNMIQGI